MTVSRMETKGGAWPKRAALAIGLGIAASAAVLAAALTIGPARADPGLLAAVDGIPITRSDFDSYSSVFTDPRGHLTIGRDQVLLSLINQVLIGRAADRLGIEIAESQVDAGVDEAMRVGKSSVQSEGGVPALRARIGRLLELQQVKAKVAGIVIPTGAEVRAEYEARLKYSGLTLDEAADEVRAQLIEREADRRWKEWLAMERACAQIDILDETVGIRSSSPEPGC